MAALIHIRKEFSLDPTNTLAKNCTNGALSHPKTTSAIVSEALIPNLYSHRNKVAHLNKSGEQSVDESIKSGGGSPLNHHASELHNRHN